MASILKPIIGCVPCEIPTTIARIMAFVFITIPQAAKGISVPYFVNAP